MARPASRLKGELREWQQDLNNEESLERKKDAMKKVIATMTVGKDVSALFPDVVKCSQTNNIELKKLVYLYIINYAKTQEEEAVMAVNTFTQDARDPNPLVRALAVRTMSCIRVERVTEYLADALRQSLADNDPYVRKTAAIAVAKIYDTNPQLVEDQGFLDDLKRMLEDSNPMVIANAVAALADISARAAQPVLELDAGMLHKLFLAVNECTEWGQVFILDALATYQARDADEAKGIAERVLPRLAHANSAVVLSAIKVVMKQLSSLNSHEDALFFCQKMTPPLVTLLLSAEPEIKYVALRNIDLIVQKQPAVLENELKVFFCKYNDPIFVKLEKLEIMIKLAHEGNIGQVLAEFKEYAQEVDTEFVRKAVRSIGRCAIKIQEAAQACIDVLLELIQNKVNYVIQEAIIVIKDIFRKYPNRYENIITTLCENLDELDEPEAKAAMVWIIGEYGHRIENPVQLLEIFTDTFEDEVVQVQLAILTAVVKVFLERPEETQEMAEKILTLCTTESDNPDLRDRGYMYFRLISEHETAARDVVLGEKPTITDDTNVLDPTVLDSLVEHIGTLASVYHKPPELFVPDFKAIRRRAQQEADEEDEDEYDLPVSSDSAGKGAAAHSSSSGGSLDIFGDSTSSSSSKPSSSAPPASIDDFFGSAPVATAPRAAAPAAGGFDLFGGPSTAGGSAAAAAAGGAPNVDKVTVLTKDKGNGLQIDGAFNRRAGQLYMDLTFVNSADTFMSGFAISVNKNPWGLAAAKPLGEFVQNLLPGQRLEFSLPFVHRGDPKENKLDVVQVAVKNNMTDRGYYFACPLDISKLFEEDGALDKKTFIRTWQSIPESNEFTFDLRSILRRSTNKDFKAVLRNSNIFFVADKPSDDGFTYSYCSAKATNGLVVLMELGTSGDGNVAVAVRCENAEVFPLVQQSLTKLLA